MNGEGQAAIEVIIIAVVLVALLLAVVVSMVRQGADTSRLSAIQRDTTQCQRISAMITGFSSSKGYSEATLLGLEKLAHIEKGSIVIGSIGCRYFGSAAKQTGDSSFDNDEDGFDLYTEGSQTASAYRVKKLGQEVLFCDPDPDNAWC